MIRQVLHSDVGAVIQYILVSCGQIPLGSAMNESASEDTNELLGSDIFCCQLSTLFGVMCATHLSLLFRVHGGILCVPKPNKLLITKNVQARECCDNEVDFLSQLILEMVEKLNADNYPTQVW